MRFYVLSCSRSNDILLQRCVASIDAQTCRRWIHYVVVDENGPGDIGIGNRFTMYNQQRLGAAANLWRMLKIVRDGTAANTDVVVLVDGDDRLEEASLEVLQGFYGDPSVWCSYGSYVCDSGAPARFCGRYEPNANIRTAKWQGSHLKTFRVGLARHLEVGWLQDHRGNFLPAGSDLALMMPILEMAGPDHRMFVSRNMYFYNDTNPWNDHKTCAAWQKEAERLVRSRHPAKRVKSI